MTLKEYREKLGITQLEMTKELNISFSYYSKIEGGFKNPSYNFVCKLKNRFKDFDTNIFYK